MDQLPADAQTVAGFSELLGPFWEHARVGQLWQLYQPRYIQELEGYRPVVREVIHEALDYFRIPARIVLDRQILLMPDLLNMVGVVNARNLDRTYTIIVGPAEEPSSNRLQLQHEYLHFLIDPLTEKFGATALENRALLEIAHAQPSIQADRRDRFLLLVGESLIEALQLRLSNRASDESARVELFREGMILVPHFLRQLEKFESSDQSLPEAVPGMFEAIKESEIHSDLASIEVVDARLRAAREAERQQLEEERTAVEANNRRVQLLNEAGQLMEQNRHDEATLRLQTLLQMDPGSGAAKFYLGQIATREQRHDEAFQYYSQTVAAQGVGPDVRAWALVRMGLYHAAHGEFQEARQRFQEVLAMQGDLRGARPEAESRLTQLPSSERPPDP